jgi:hypothetical protein
MLAMINPLLNSPAISFPQTHSWVEIRASLRLIPHWTRLTVEILLQMPQNDYNFPFLDLAAA